MKTNVRKLGGTMYLDGKFMAQCWVCKKTQESLTQPLQLWEMKTFHFGSLDQVQVLTCDKCKSKDNGELLHKIQKHFKVAK